MKIKLTENDLKQIVAESVQKVLSELDWKTYASAYEKDKDPRRREKFLNAAQERFGQNYGYNEPSFEDTQLYRDTTGLGKDHMNNLVLHNSHWTPVGGTLKSRQTNFTTYKDDDDSVKVSRGRYDGTKQVERPFANNKQHARAMQKASDEFNGYVNGQAKYVKGQGWTTDTVQSPDWHDYMDYNNPPND